MQIFDLFNIPETFLESVGGKAKGLYRLHKAGLAVPRGFVLYNIENEEDFDKAIAYYLDSNLQKVAVRSSASGEDGVEYSNAGQYSTFLNIEGKEKLRESIRECMTSLQNERAQKYAHQFLNDQSSQMTVVVQEFVNATKAGVSFTVNPTNNDNSYLVEAVKGLGESLVSGTETAEQYSISKNSQHNDAAFEEAGRGKEVLTKEELKEICRELGKAQQYLAYEVDAEWAINETGEVLWLQARPITTGDAPTISEFDCKRDLTNHVVTSCNIGEMLPGAVTPLSLSTSVYGIDWGMRDMFVRIGAYKSMEEIGENSCALSIGNHLFIDMTTIYKLGKTILGTGKAGAELSIIGKLVEDAPDIQGDKAFVIKRIINTFKYVRFLLSKNKAKEKLIRMSEELHFEEKSTCKEQYDQINENINQLNLALSYHYVTSSYSGGISSALFIALERDFEDKEELKAKIAGCLENIDDIESVDILRSLRKIARSLIAENPEVVNYSSEQLAACLKQCGAATKKEYQYFIDRHGHRAIREAELRSKGWKDDEKALMDYLKTVIASGAHEKKNERIVWMKHRNRLLRRYGWPKRFLFGLIVGEARRGVRLREFSKSKIIKVIDKFKIAYNRLAQLMVEQNLLMDEDCIFFLTHSEIGKLINENETSLIKKALARRVLFNEQKMLRFPEISIGYPQPIEATEIDPNQKVLKGVPVSRGISYGKARVIKSVEDAQQLTKGEIMVSSFTDIGWSPYYCLLNGLITEVGSALSHGAVVAREYSLPLIVNVPNATQIIKTGDFLAINGNTGEMRILDEAEAERYR